MKLHSQCRCRKINGCPKDIPDGLLNEEWAKRNHDQSLETLNKRGGVTLEEALAIIQQRSFYELNSPEKAITIYAHILTGFNAAAALCEEKIKAAIELARKTDSSLWVADKNLIYTPEEILQKLNEQKT